ncbi:STAS domain-containing protein [Streptomyces sp. AM6-12]|uniref:STAS domain-containing protein n=1 Tax=Streptomyces sp. AM6-12 TaxID=3345149 RepID=UPI0037A363E1
MHDPGCRAVALYSSRGARTGVEILGELDLDSGRGIRGKLREALTRSARGLDLDLSGLEFCDCAGLSVLMDLRQQAALQGKTVVVRAVSPMVDRLLAIVGARELFAPAAEPNHPASAGFAAAPAVEASPSAALSRSRTHMTWMPQPSCGAAID